MAVPEWVRNSRVVVPTIVVATAVVTMVVRLHQPDRIFFDETYYVNDARDFLEFGVEQGFVVHPPLGKLLIATGIHLVGDSPLGWRLVGGLLGVASVALVYAVARRFGLSRPGAGLAGLALAMDGAFLVQARTAMLDIHLAFFVVLGFWALVRDRDHVRRADDLALARVNDRRITVPPRTPAAARALQDGPRVATERPEGIEPVAAPRPVPPAPTLERDDAGGDPGHPDQSDVGHDPRPPPHPAAPADAPPLASDPVAVDGPPRATTDLPRVSRWWLLLAGVSFGAAVGVKWSGALALVAAVAVVLAWELGRRRRVTGRVTARPLRVLAMGIATLGLVPVLVYAATWTPWFVAFDNTYTAEHHCDGDDGLDCDGVDGRVGALADYHRRMVDFHLGLDAEHSYRAAAHNWPIQRRPVVFYYETCSQDRLQRVEETDSDGNVTVPEPCVVDTDEAAEILDVGNPATWWLFVALLPLAGAALRSRMRGAWPVATFMTLQFVPWLIASRPVFNFYVVPLVPFLALGLALAVERITARTAWVRTMGTGLVVAATAGGAAIGLRQLGLSVSWVLVAYAAGVGGLVGGAATPQPAPATDRPARTWPTLAVAGLIVLVGLYFLPVWWGIPGPKWFIESHWWLPTWV